MGRSPYTRAIEEGRDVVFIRGVEPSPLTGRRPAHQAIAADHGFGTPAHVAVENQKVVAVFVEGIEFPPRHRHLLAGPRVHLLTKNAVAQGLRGGDLGRGFGQADDQVVRAQVDGSPGPLFGESRRGVVPGRVLCGTASRLMLERPAHASARGAPAHVSSSLCPAAPASPERVP